MATYTTLRRGSSGDEVKKYQQTLKDAGYTIDVDGKYGPQTESITKAYQKANGLSVDGIAGNQTLGKLYGGSTTTTTTATAPKDTSFKYEDFQYTAPQDSDIVKQAEAAIQQHMAANKQSTWTDTLNETINKILNKEEFSYDLNGDALYQQYKDQYTTQGQMAMMDTMGQAQAMTGGYGNSYAQSVGQQAYQGYLQKLNDKVPKLYQLALNQYNQEKKDLYSQASMLSTLEQKDMDNYYKELDFLTGERDTLYDRETDEVDRALSLWADKQKYTYDISEATKTDAYNKAKLMLGLGTMPDAQTLASAGISSAEAQAIVNKVLENEKKATSGGSGSGGSGGNGGGGGNGGYNNGGQTTSDIKKMQAALGITADGKWGPASVKASGGLTADEAYTAWKNGTLGEEPTPDPNVYADWDAGDWESYFAQIRQSEGKSAAEEELRYFTSNGLIPNKYVSFGAIGARGGSMGH